MRERSKSATISEVASLANVSTATVSHVINKSRYVAPEKEAAVRNAMAELNYRPNMLARSLRTKRTDTIGLLMPLLVNDTSNLFFIQVAMGIQNTLRPEGISVIFADTHESGEDIASSLSKLKARFIDGLIIAPTGEDSSFEDKVSDIPTVFIDRYPGKSTNSDCVLIDNFDSSYIATNLLINRGCNRVGFASGPLGLSNIDERYHGFLKAIEESPRAIYPQTYLAYPGVFEGDMLGKRVIEDRLDGIFAADNGLALDITSYCMNSGIKIPEELAIIGFDDFHWSQVTTPPLTVISQPAYDMGVKAAEYLLERIKAGGSADLPGRILKLPSSLIIRKSC